MGEGCGRTERRLVATRSILRAWKSVIVCFSNRPEGAPTFSFLMVLYGKAPLPTLEIAFLQIWAMGEMADVLSLALIVSWVVTACSRSHTEVLIKGGPRLDRPLAQHSTCFF